MILQELQNNDYAVIVANGDYPTNEIPLAYIKKANYIVCCDGATNELVAHGIEPNAIVGDCDSISQENRERFANIIHHISEQETNDLTKAVNFCIQQKIKNIVIVGATGKREDHTIGNISLLANYLNKDKSLNIKMITDFGIFVALQGKNTICSPPRLQVSIFSIDQTPISSYGLRYPLKELVLSEWWQGTLNETLDEKFTLESEGRLIVYLAY